MKQTTILLTDEQHKLLKKRSQLIGCSIGSIIRTLLTNFFERRVTDESRR